MLNYKIQSDSEDVKVQFEVNADYKEEFLDTLKKSTRKYYSYILKLADENEKEIGKSLFNYSIEDRDELLVVKFKNKTIFSFQTTLSPLKKYVDWCISKNFVTHYQNRFAAILTKDYKNYINMQAMENSYIPKSEVRELENKLVNAQDKLIIELLSWGVRGRTEKGNTLEELINLKVTDINWDQKVLYLTSNDGEKRPLDIDDFTLNLLRKTIDSEHYIFGNGFSSKKNEEGNYDKTEKGFIINPTDYVFRVPGRKKFGKIDHQLIANRIQRIQEWLGTPYLNISSLWLSSMIDAAKAIKEEKGELTKADYISLNERFNYGEENNWKKYFAKSKELINLYI